jgi:hypothetical protein
VLSQESILRLLVKYAHLVAAACIALLGEIGTTCDPDRLLEHLMDVR